MAADHEAVDDLLTRLLSPSASNGRGELADEFVRGLRAHVRSADELLVPALRRRANGHDLEQLAKVEAINSRLAEELERMARIPPADPGFDAQLRRVREELTKHADLEEMFVLPRTEDLVPDDELISLGTRIERFEQALLQAPGLRARLAQGAKAMPFDPAKLARTVAMIVAAGVLLAVLDRIGRQRLRTGDPIPPRQ
jgi:hypothetical protein